MRLARPSTILVSPANVRRLHTAVFACLHDPIAGALDDGLSLNAAGMRTGFGEVRQDMSAA
jgi:hypothetical protein